MEWSSLYTAAVQPTYEEIQDYIGGEGRALWKSLFDFMENTYKCKPKMTYSGCSGKPGWNVKFQKSGQAFGTLYPEIGGFSVMMVIAYRLDPEMEFAKLDLSPKMREIYENSGDYMKMGRWFMFRIETEADLADYKRLCAVKLKPKN